MATVATPGLAFEDALASIVPMMANAVLTLGAGAAVGTEMPAVFTQPVADGVGDQRLPGREPTALVPTASLVADVRRGSPVSVLYRGATTTWVVQHRTDTPESGDTLLNLEEPAA